MSEIRFGIHPDQTKTLDSQGLRDHFLIDKVFEDDNIHCSYSMYDRMMILGIKPTNGTIELPKFEDLTKADYFLERREMGVINTGGPGQILVDGEVYDLAFKECIYIGKGIKNVAFESTDATFPAEFYINSLPAHASYPTAKASLSDATRVELGSTENCNERVIFQYIHEDGIQSCQLVMGFTELKVGSVWNTFPPHTHYRRMEAYFYFEIPKDQLVMHFMGDPTETRHIVMRDKQAVISPEWSIHSGAGTSSYSFIWGMGGENKAFTDMDPADLNLLR